MMEAKQELSSGMPVKGNEAPESFRLAPRTENSFPNPNFDPNPNHNPNPNPNPNFNHNPSSNLNANPNPNPNINSISAQLGGAAAITISPASLSTEAKKKRGRPRKYAPDGSLAKALSPVPLSASIPIAGGEFSTWKKGKARSSEAVKKQPRSDYESRGDGVAYFGANFTPHVLTVYAGEDVTMKVMSFSQQGSRAICILSANGTISNVTLRQPTTSGGTLTYEGRFEILSLSGSFMPSDSGGTKSRSGGMSVSLAGPDGRVVGGGLAGLLVAAGPVQVVVGSFLLGHQQEQKHKKQRIELAPAVPPVNLMSAEEIGRAYSGVNNANSSAFYGGNSVAIDAMQAFKKATSDNKTTSSPDEDDVSGDPDLSNGEASS